MISPGNISIRSKLTGLFLLMGLLPLLVVGWFANHHASEARLASSVAQLEAIRQTKKQQVEHYFAERKNDTLVLASSDTIVEGMDFFHEIFHAFEEKGQQIGGQAWQHALDPSFIDWLELYGKTYGYEDLLFIDGNGNIVYTTARKADLGENVLHGPLKNSPLGRLFTNVQRQSFAIQDFDTYAPSDDHQAAFFGGIIQKKGQFHGIIALELPTQGIDAIMTTQTGMGHTGEAFLMGAYRGVTFYRSHRTSNKSTIGQQGENPVIEQALAGESGSEIRVDTLGEPKLFSYAPIQVVGLKWAIIASMTMEEIKTPTNTLIQVTLLLSLVLATLVVLVAWYTAQHFANTLNKLIVATHQIAGGAWSSRVAVDGTDEFGQLGIAFNQMAENNEMQFWIKSHTAEFSTLLQQANTPEMFAQDLIRKLTPLLDAGHGAVYLLDKDSGRYHLMGGYAYAERKHLSNVYASGESIVGQCALEKEPILLTEVPHDHVRITTGLGDSLPLTILAVPLMFQDTVWAVIEMASHDRFTERQRALLDELAPMFGLGFENQNHNQRTALLLKQTQKQAQEMTALAEELQIQQEKLRAANNILQEQTEALQASEEELKMQQEELQATNRELADRARLLEAQKDELAEARQEIDQKTRALATAKRSKQTETREDPPETPTETPSTRPVADTQDPTMHQEALTPKKPAQDPHVPQKTHTPATPRGSETATRFKNKTVLLVDDDMRNLYALSKILKTHGLTILTANNGKQSLQVLDENPDLDMILMDLMMPVMDGYQAMREMRQQARFKKTPIIALTAKAMQLDREKCLQTGANDYLPKPVDVEKLLSLLEVWLPP